MYRLIRNLHLGAGLICAAALLMYGLSAVQMLHESRFDLGRQTRQSATRIAPGLDSGRSLAALLMDRGLIRGELTWASSTPASLTLRIARPGTVSDVSYDRASGQVTIKTTSGGLFWMFNRLHHSAGIWHEYWLLKLWTVFVALISLGLIGLGVSGLYLWFIRRQDRVTGYILLAASLTYTLTLSILIRSAGP